MIYRYEICTLKIRHTNNYTYLVTTGIYAENKDYGEILKGGKKAKAVLKIEKENFYKLKHKFVSLNFINTPLSPYIDSCYHALILTSLPFNFNIEKDKYLRFDLSERISNLNDIYENIDAYLRNRGKLNELINFLKPYRDKYKLILIQDYE